MSTAIQKIEQANPDAFQDDSYLFVMAVYKDPAQPLEIRLKAAGAAIAYEKPTLLSIQRSA